MFCIRNIVASDVHCHDKRVVTTQEFSELEQAYHFGDDREVEAILQIRKRQDTRRMEGVAVGVL